MRTVLILFLAFCQTGVFASFTCIHRPGMPGYIVDGAGEREFEYDYAGRIIREAVAYGLLSGVELHYRYNPTNGRSQIKLQTPSAWTTNDIAFDACGRISIDVLTNFLAARTHI